MNQFVNTAEAHKNSTELLGLVLDDLRNQYAEYVVDEGEGDQKLMLAGQASLHNADAVPSYRQYRALIHFSPEAALPSLSLRTIIARGYYRDDIIPDTTAGGYKVKSVYDVLENDKELTDDEARVSKAPTQTIVDVIRILPQLQPQVQEVRKGLATREAKRRWGWLGKLARGKR